MNDEFNKEELTGEKQQQNEPAVNNEEKSQINESPANNEPVNSEQFEQPVQEKAEQPTQEQPPVQQAPENPQNPPQPQQPAYQQFYTEQRHYFPNGAPISPQNQAPNGSQIFNQKPPKKDNGRLGLKIFAGILAAALIFSLGTSIGYLVNRDSSVSSSSANESDGSDDSLQYSGEDITVNQEQSVTKSGIKPDEDGNYTADEVAKLVADSVVNINVYSTSDSSVGAIASGVILNKDGYIISNDHIYSEVANAQFVITMADGTSYKAKYIAGDQRSDISVLKFTEMPKNFTPATFADSSSVSAGDSVIAIGSPYGLSGTVTEGIISSPSRRISFSTSDSSGNTTGSYSMRVIQTDTALNSGNSGGALVNMKGQVVGISSSKIVVSGYEGLCFAIPSNDAIKYAKSLTKNGKVIGRAKLGITYKDISSASAKMSDTVAGLQIQTIDKSSELASKGLVQGDIITEINGKSITSADIALDVIDDSSAGDTIKLKIFIASSKKYKTYSVKLLEDTSTSSYSTQLIPQTTTSGYEDYFDGSNGNGSNGSGSNGKDSDGGYYFDFGQ